MLRGDCRVRWEGGKDEKIGIGDEPSRSNLEEKYVDVVRGEIYIKDKRSVTVTLTCACRVNIMFERDRQFDHAYLPD